MSMSLAALGLAHLGLGAALVAAGALAIGRAARPWVLPALALVTIFVGLRALAYPSIMAGGDHPDWTSFLTMYYDDPRSPLSMVMFTVKAAFRIPGYLTERGLAALGLPLPDPAFLLSGRAGGIFFDLCLLALLLGCAWAFLPLRSQPWMLAAAAAAYTLNPTHVYLSATISYNLLGEAVLVACFLCLVLALSELDRVRRLIAAGACTAGTVTPGMVRLAAAWALAGLAVALLAGTKWLFVPLLLPLVWAMAARARADAGMARQPGRRDHGQALLLLDAAVVGALVLWTVAFYVLFTYSKVLGSGEHFSRNFGFFASVAAVAPLSELGHRLGTLVTVILVPNLGWPAVVLGTAGYGAAVIHAAIRRRSWGWLFHLWTAGVILQSAFSNFLTLNNAAMPRNTLLMALIPFYAVTLCRLAGRAASSRWGHRVGGVVGVAPVVVMLAAAALPGLAYEEYLAGPPISARLAAGLGSEPAGSAVCSMAQDPWVFAPQSNLRFIDGDAADPSSCPGDIWLTSSADVRRDPRRSATLRGALEPAGFVLDRRFETDGRLGAYARPLLTGELTSGLFHIHTAEIWRRKRPGA